MSCILNIETSTNICSVAVSQDGAVIYQQQDEKGTSQNVSLGCFVDKALSFIDSHVIKFPEALLMSSRRASPLTQDCVDLK